MGDVKSLQTIRPGACSCGVINLISFSFRHLNKETHSPWGKAKGGPGSLPSHGLEFLRRCWQFPSTSISSSPPCVLPAMANYLRNSKKLLDPTLMLRKLTTTEEMSSRWIQHLRNVTAAIFACLQLLEHIKQCPASGPLHLPFLLLRTICPLQNGLLLILQVLAWAICPEQLCEVFSFCWSVSPNSVSFVALFTVCNDTMHTHGCILICLPLQTGSFKGTTSACLFTTVSPAYCAGPST